MSFHWCDNFHTTVFTPRDYQVELLAAAYERNTMICLGHKSSKEFIALKLLQEMAKEARAAQRFCIYLTCKQAQSMYTMVQHLTDLKVLLLSAAEEEAAQETDTKSNPFTQAHEVYIVHPRILLQQLRKSVISLAQVHLLILDDCHELDVYQQMLPIFQDFYDAVKCKHLPRVLGLAGPLHSAGCQLPELSAMLSTLEETVFCKAETASDIVTVLRYCSKPLELIVLCAPYDRDELTTILEDIICTRKAFLNDHRYDPTEIYNTDEFLEELKDIPCPKQEPLDFLNTILEVLHEMGPWSAYRVANSMFHRIEKQKIKTPHERHYILLCLVNTALFEIHAICEQTFARHANHKTLIETYSSPKVLRLLQILREIRPQTHVLQNAAIGNINNVLENIDFQKLTRSLEHSCQSVENIAKQQLESRSIVENLDPIVAANTELQRTSNRQPIAGKPSNTTTATSTTTKTEHKRVHKVHMKRRAGFTRRRNHDAAGNADTLCALIFCNHNHTARVLFDLLADMSRHDEKLRHLRCQYTTDRVADPLTEPKEAEQEHRRQEEVLKRFRMHDCNVLIGTAVLEEGIDLPKCNLVVRWDPPKTYRSYVQCKGRARADPAHHIMLVAPKFCAATHLMQHKEEQLSARSHRYLCAQKAEEEDDEEDNEESDTSNDETLEGLKEQPQKFTIGCAKGIVKILNPEVITSKPPTSSQIVLKEIKDETLAIEMPAADDVAAEDGVALDLIDDEASLEVSLVEDNSKSVNNATETTTVNGITDCFEVLDLSDAISEANEKANDSLKSFLSPRQSKAAAEKCPPTHSKRQFQCCIEAVEESPMEKPLSAEQHQALMLQTTNEIVEQLAQYQQIEKLLLQKCANAEPAEDAHRSANKLRLCVTAYKPHPELLTGATVDLNTAIGLVNKYSSKLPSDTFTKLTPLWRCAKTVRDDVEMFQYTLRLPINSPLKYDIVGLPMHTEVLARRMAALQTCKTLHLCGELDDNLQPIGKEGFRAIEPDWENFELEASDEKIVQENSEPRPGTTKRRQYYYKRIASEFCDCRPTVGTPCYLYFIDLKLQCPIPEEQNTRGRKIYPPEDAQQGFGILTLKKIPKVSAFPIFTRSGEVKVSLRLAHEMIVLNEQQIRCINTFLNYTFTNVLRLQKFLMLFDPDSTENCVFIVPTLKAECAPGGRIIDWTFLDVIERNANMMPIVVPETVRRTQEFNAAKFKDAVVMPWYRNQDQPQYFYVAEICPQLTPLSCFPGENYNTFKHYYFAKYGITIQNVKQPLLDVDHTSARLNFLTPRYVNRKGVALPTSSEETKRAKRENLEQKQILVPELCTVHPFPASLWRTAVCLPCILYRINGLLLADDIRKKVSHDIGLGQQEMRADFEWPMLDFGWSLSEVLRKSKEAAHKSNVAAIAAAAAATAAATLASQLAQEQKEMAAAKVERQAMFKLEKSANEIVIEKEKQLKDTSLIEIGTWSNDMADGINSNRKSETNDEDDEELLNEFLPSNLSFCDGSFEDLEDQPMRIGSPTFWDVTDTDNKDTATTETFNATTKENQRNTRKNSTASYTYYDSDDSYVSSYDGDYGNAAAAGYSTDDDDDDEQGPLRIAFTSKNEAETIETEQEIEKRNKKLSIIQDTTVNERIYQETKNLQVGYNLANSNELQRHLAIAEFIASTELLKQIIQQSGMIIKPNKSLGQISLVRKNPIFENNLADEMRKFCLQKNIVPYVDCNELEEYLKLYTSEELTIADIERFNSNWVRTHPKERFTIVGCGDIFDRFNDKSNMNLMPVKDHKSDEKCKQIALNFESNNKSTTALPLAAQHYLNGVDGRHEVSLKTMLSFDYQPDLKGHPGPSPSIILQGLTMSNANDGINLERLETIGDSFLKYAITTYLYITYDNVHEGKLSHLRSKQVANLNLYRLGRRKMLGEYMIATKFEPHDNWLPPCYYVPKELEKALIEAKIPPHHWKLVDLPNIKKLTSTEICELVREKADSLGLFNDDSMYSEDLNTMEEPPDGADFTCFIPYNLVTQHSIPDKSVADCVEALIGAYLIECGSRGALLLMAWLGIRVLPFERQRYDATAPRVPGSTNPDEDNMITVYGEWAPPKSPLLHYSPNARVELDSLLDGFDEFEQTLQYKFRDRSYLLQAMTHASYSPNRLTDCYQRLEFLGDAVLDYLITRHLYEDPRQHSPGALTDLRSALVNNTIFASLAVRHGFHKYFRHLSPGLNEVINRFVRIQNENGHCISEEYYLLSEEECDDAEDVEVPKALGDVFESIAGAIFLDSNMSLDVVWQVYSNMMKPEIEQFSNSVPKSPIRELLELEPETAKFGKPEKLADGRRVRVTVEVFCKGIFRGIGRNYRIAKCTAAKCALRQLKKQGLITKKDT